MEDKFVLKPCPHCGSEATLASPDQWSYLSCIVFCPSCLAKGPQGYDYAKAIGGWMYRLVKLGSDESFYNLMIYEAFTDLSVAIKKDLQRYCRP